MVELVIEKPKNEREKMVKWIKKLLGIDAATRIRSTASRFSSVVDTLRSAISELDGDIISNQVVIQSLKAENTELGASKVTALKLIAGIKNLLGD